MSEFITRVGSGEYQVIFKTDSVEKYHAVEDFCREIIDHGKPSVWISVKDRMPEKSGQYLCWFGANKVAIGMAIVTYVNEWKAFGRLESFEKYPNITHWMPLPEPPKEET